MSLRYEKNIIRTTIVLTIILLSQQSTFYLDYTHAATQSSDLLIADNTTCFPTGTKIIMADHSYKNIEDITIGDKVQSFNTYNNCAAVGVVTKVYKHPPAESKGYYIFTTENGENLRITPEHILLVNNKWLPAYMVKIGDHFRTINGKETKIISIQHVFEKTWEYNLEVEPYNTFFAEGILVHNAKAPSEPYVPQPDIIIPDNITILCCLPAGTQIVLADKSTKSIENIKVGDKILSYDTEKQDFVCSKATKKIIKIREGVYDINHGLIKITDDHPLYVRKKNGTLCWAAINPRKSKLAYSFRKPMHLEIGDELFTFDGKWVRIDSITFKPGPIKTYTFAVDSIFHNYFANNVLVSNAVAELCGGDDEDDDIDHYDAIDDDGDDDHPPVEIIKISVSPNPPVERANITIDAPTADTVTVQLVEKKFDMAGVYLYSEKIDSYKWRCFIPSNSADKFVYIQASNLEGGRGIYWSKAIQKNQTPPQKFELILDTYPFDLALKGVFKLYPDPVEILTPTDGRVHAVYEERTRVNITAQNYEDYVFEYWTGTGIKDTSSDNPLITLMNQDKEYIAHYKEKTEQHPTLSYSPKAYNFSDMLEGEIASATFKIWNNGTGTLNYNLSESAEWLSVSPSSGSSTGEQNKNTIEVYINTTNLSPGNYSANISIESNGGSGNFSVNLMVSSTPSSPVIKIITPNGGENWQIGGLYEIRWRSIGNVGEKVKIELYRGNNLFKILSTNISNVGKCRWVVSTDIPPGYDYRIKISSIDNEEIYDFSDGIFSLYTPSTLHFLFISSPPVCYEKLPFSVTVYDEEGNYVKNATVSFYGQSVRTDSKGKAPPIFAPSVDKDTPAFIIASKRGYVYATSTPVSYTHLTLPTICSV